MVWAYELWAGNDQLNTSISMESGAATAIVHFLGQGTLDVPVPPGLDDLCNFTSYLTGSVGNTAPIVSDPATSPDAGKILRNLPLIHPFMPQISVAGVTSITGASEGGKATTDATLITGLTPLAATVDLCQSYLFKVELQKRRYFLLSDDAIGRTQNTYHPPDGSAGIDYIAANEWTRFTEKVLVPKPDTASATFGQQVFQTHASQAATNPQFANTTYVYLQNQLLQFTWHQVPYRYFFNQTAGGVTYKPYLTRFVNCVNQYDWAGFPAGSLMFLGATPTPYIPQIPDIDFFAGDNVALAQDLLCNVVMSFLYTAREVNDPPQAGDTMLTNRNFVPAGHNAFPRFDTRQFEYCPTLGPSPFTDQTKWQAPFFSFPFELLWTDPMAKQGGVI